MAAKKKVIEAPPVVMEPQGICLCTHLGDGPMSDHGGLIGHGPCAVPGCNCPKFTWMKFTPYGQRRLNEIVKAK